MADTAQVPETPDVSLEGASTTLESLLFPDDAAPNDEAAAAAPAEEPQETSQDSAAEEQPAEDAAPEETPPSGEENSDEGEPAQTEPPIAAPLSWSKDAQEAWKSLPPETQKIVAARENARDAEVRRVQNEQADLTKALDAEREQTARERQQYAQNLQHLSLLVQPELARFAKIDWQKLAEEDPAAYIREQASYQAIAGRVNAVTGEMQRIQQEQQAEQAQRTQALLKEEQARLVAKVPEFADQATAKAFSKELSEWLAEQGFTPQELGSIADHRLIVVARKAMLAEKQAASRQEAQAKQAAAKASAAAKKAPPTTAQQRVVKPGAAKVDRTDAAAKRVSDASSKLAKTGNVRDAAALLEQFL